MSTSVLYVHYIIPEDGDDATHPNVFALKGFAGAQAVSVADIHTVCD